VAIDQEASGILHHWLGKMKEDPVGNLLFCFAVRISGPEPGARHQDHTFLPYRSNCTPKFYFNRVPGCLLLSRLSCLCAGDSLRVAPRAVDRLTLAQVPRGRAPFAVVHRHGNRPLPLHVEIGGAVVAVLEGGARSWRAEGSGPQLLGYGSVHSRPARRPVYDDPPHQP